MDDTHLSSSWEILDRKMNKSEFTNVKKLQDPPPHFYCFREELRPRKKKKSLLWNGKLCLHFSLSLKADPGNNRFNLGFIIFLQIISEIPKQEMKNFRPNSNDTSSAFLKETKLKKKVDKHEICKHFLDVLKAHLSLDHGLWPARTEYLCKNNQYFRQWILLIISKMEKNASPKMSIEITGQWKRF